jgi:hypothetical protein
MLRLLIFAQLVEIFEPEGHYIIVEWLTGLNESQVYIQIWLVYAFNYAYVALGQLFKGIMSKLDDISYERGRDCFLDDILRLDFLTD